MWQRLPVGLSIAVLLLALADVAPPATTVWAREPAPRIVSMNPSLTAILIDLGVTGTLVGVEEQSRRLHPEVADLPVVGGLFNPSVEAVVALQPDWVVMVPSAQQRDFRRRLTDLGIEVLLLPNIRFEEILESITVLGELVGKADAARRRIEQIQRVREEVRRAAAERPRIRAVVVVQRDPLFVVGRGNFVDEMLRSAGADNAAAELGEPFPRAGVEWLIAAAPDVILDATEESPEPARYWARWPSIPAVASGRVLAVAPELITMPGPHLDRGLRALAEVLAALHGADPSTNPTLDPPRP